jgi:hypothetical protein
MKKDEAGLRQKRATITVDQFVFRCGLDHPRILLVESMMKERVVEAVAGGDWHRPMLAFVMHPETYVRATTEAYRRWGVRGNWIGDAEALVMRTVARNEVVLPVLRMHIHGKELDLVWP